MATSTTPQKSSKPADPVDAVKAVAGEHIESHRVRNWRALIFQAYLVFSVIAFSILMVLANMFNYFPIDLRITRAVQTIHSPLFATFMEWISVIGYVPEMPIIIAICFILIFAIGLRWEAIVTLIAAAGSASLAGLIKVVVHRPRPGADLVTVLQQLNSYSFPSGHVLTYTAFFGFLFFLCFILLKPSPARVALFIILGGLISLIGLSRIYVGDHWASDVAGAYLLGSLWLVLCVYIYRWGKPRFFVTQPLAQDKSNKADIKS